MNNFSQHFGRCFRLCVLGTFGAFCVAVLTGCDTGVETRVANKGEIRNIINVMTQADGNPDVVAELFVEGAAPSADWFKRIKGKFIETDEVTIDENEATVTFTVESDTGDIEADCEWKFVQQEGQWFISDAPVPSP